MRSWLYQPFLYYFIHKQPPLRLPRANSNIIDAVSRLPTQHDFVSAAFHGDPSLNAEDATALYHFLTSGIDCNLKILDVRSLRHRHHGLWYDMRSVMCAALILLVRNVDFHKIHVSANALLLMTGRCQGWPRSLDPRRCGNALGIQLPIPTGPT